MKKRSEYGTPYSVQELRGASKQPADPYHRDLMKWAAKEIERLQRLVTSEPTDKEIEQEERHEANKYK